MKIFIYNASLENEKDIEARQKLIDQIKIIDERIKQRTIIFSGLLKGIIISKNKKSSQSENNKLISGGEQMKFKGISIIKHKTCNTWYARYRQNGKQVYISAKTQAECYNKLKQELKTIEREKQPKHYTLKSWFNKWLELFKIDKVKQATLNDYNYIIKNVKDNILNKDISKITSLEILENLKEIKGERQREKLFIFLKDIFTKAFNYKIIKDNIFNVLEKPKRAKTIVGEALSKEEQQKLISVAEQNEQYYIFLIILYQGLRRGEALALTFKDFNLEKQTLTINKSQNEHNELGSTKNIYSNRTIPLFNKTIDILKLFNRDSEKLVNYTTHSIYDKFKQLLKQANVNSNYRIHDLRHTFITNCKNINIPEHIIQSWVGHQIGSKVTSEVYTHKQEDISKLNANLLNKLYSNYTQKKED